MRCQIGRGAVLYDVGSAAPFQPNELRAVGTSCGAYPWTIAFLGVFIGYQLYRLSLGPSVGLAALTVFDAGIAWLTYREYRKQLALARR